MHDPTARSGLTGLQEILEEGVALLAGLHRSEESLQEQLIRGDYRALAAAEKERSELQRRLAALEEKRRQLVPRGMSIRGFMAQLAGTKTAATRDGEAGPDLLPALLDQFRDELLQVYALQEVNRELLRERLRFSREIQALLLGREAYTDRGEASHSAEKSTIMLDRNC